MLRSVAAFVALAFVGGGCSAVTSAQGPVASGSDDIISVPQTDVERLSIGSTWIYAHVAWVESMHSAATGEAFEVSPAYWTYWHWFDQVAGGAATTLSTGGNWETANGIVKKYGLTTERAFVGAEATMDMPARQAAALTAINASLKSGPLSAPGARADKALVRRELDRAWGLGADVVAMLDRVFGADVSRSFTSLASPADPTGTDTQRPRDFAVAYAPSPGSPNVQRHLDQAMQDWRQVYYAGADRRRPGSPTGASSRPVRSSTRRTPRTSPSSTPRCCPARRWSSSASRVRGAQRIPSAPSRQGCPQPATSPSTISTAR